jgi:hypothetical protein
MGWAVIWWVQVCVLFIVYAVVGVDSIGVDPSRKSRIGLTFVGVGRVANV